MSQDDTSPERTAPVHRYGRIPWSVYERAYAAYRERYGDHPSREGQTPAERLAERGGFGIEEMDEYLPGWREEVEEIPRLRRELEALRLAIGDAEPEQIADWRRTAWAITHDRLEFHGADSLFYYVAGEAEDWGHVAQYRLAFYNTDTDANSPTWIRWLTESRAAIDKDMGRGRDEDLYRPG